MGAGLIKILDPPYLSSAQEPCLVYTIQTTTGNWIAGYDMTNPQHSEGGLNKDLIR
jgi:hypothetical protein